MMRSARWSVLVADDEPAARRGVRQLLGAFPAFGVVGECRDGREVLEDIKSDPRLMHIPVVILTSSQAEEDILRSYRLHANCFITKPVDLEQLTRVVQGIEQFWFTLVRLPPEV